MRASVVKPGLSRLRFATRCCAGLEVGNRSVRAGYEHLGNAVDRIANFAEELVLSPDGAAMLSRVMVVASDLLRSDVLGVELQYLVGLVIRPNHGLGVAHVY